MARGAILYNKEKRKIEPMVSVILRLDGCI
jgi:hypothetical protein